MKNIIWILLCFALLLPQTAMASNDLEQDVTDNVSFSDTRIKFEHLTMKDGLSQNLVRKITQDKQGFMWFLTGDGANRYNGYEFTVFRNDPDDPDSLSDNDCMTIHAGRDGDIWIGTTSGGLNKFDHETETFIHYTHNPNDINSLSSDSALSIYEDRGGILWIGTRENGLNRFDLKTEKFTHFRHDPKNINSLSGNSIQDIYEDSTGIIWLAVEGGFDRLNPVTGDITRYQPNPNNLNSISHHYINTVIKDKAGFYWVGARGGLNRFDPSKQTFKRYLHNPLEPGSISNDIIRATLLDSQERLWIATDSGLNLFNPENETFQHFYHEPGVTDSLTSSTVQSLFEDKNGILWIGTFDKGISKLDRGISKFKHYKNVPNNSNSQLGNNVITILEDLKGVIWLGTDKGVTKFEPKTGIFTNYSHNPADPHSLSPGYVRSIAMGRDDVLWVAVFRGGLHRFNPIEGNFTHYRPDPDDPEHSLNDIDTRAVHIASDGIVWVGTFSGGLNKLDPITGEVGHYTHNPADSLSIRGNSITLIYPDRNNEKILWLGGVNNGLIRFDKTSGQVVRYQYEPNNIQSLSNNQVLDVNHDADGNLWVGTANGLNKFDLQSKTFTRYSKKDGLPNNRINGVLEDNQGYLWISTNKGLSQFDPKTETFRNYDERDGLQGDEFNLKASYKRQNSELLFGGTNGFNSFNPKNLKDNSFIPPVVLTDFQLFNESVSIGGEDSPLIQVINRTQEVTLSQDQSIFSIKFAALSYRASEKNQYAYILEGFEQDWNYVDSTRRFASYTNLDPGHYTFRVKASNNDGIWNEEGKTIKITILPPWWQTFWFRTFTILAVLSLLFSGFRWRVKAIERRSRWLEVQVTNRTEELADSNELLKTAKEKAETANQAKSTFLANMSHDLRTPLNAVLGFSEILFHREHNLQNKNYLQSIQSSGKALLSLINDVLDLSKIEAGKFELQYTAVSMQNLFKEMSTIFQHKISNKGLTLEVQVDTRLPDSLLLDEARLRQVLMNLLGNAIKFTDEGFIRISCHAIEIEEDIKSRVNLIIEVTDSGKGIPTDDHESIFNPFEQASGQKATQYEGTGLGLAITKNIICTMSGSITVKSKVGHGSTFRVELKDVEITAKMIDEVENSWDFDPNSVKFAPAKVLIVDDIDYNRDVLAGYLNLFNLTLYFADNGRKAVEQAQKYSPDLILMDMKMPDMDGYEASKILKSGETTGDIPIVAVTASALAHDEEIIRQYCDDYLRKPISQYDLIKALKKFLKYTVEKKTTKEDVKTNMAVPKKAELEELHEVALYGDMDQLIVHLDRLEQKNGKLIKFCDQFRSYAVGYKVDKILTLLKEYLSE